MMELFGHVIFENTTTVKTVNYNNGKVELSLL